MTRAYLPSNFSGRCFLRRDEFLKPDAMSEVILLGAGALVLAVLMVILVVVLTKPPRRSEAEVCVCAAPTRAPPNIAFQKPAEIRGLKWFFPESNRSASLMFDNHCLWNRQNDQLLVPGDPCSCAALSCGVGVRHRCHEGVDRILGGS